MTTMVTMNHHQQQKQQQFIDKLISKQFVSGSVYKPRLGLAAPMSNDSVVDFFKRVDDLDSIKERHFLIRNYSNDHVFCHHREAKFAIEELAELLGFRERFLDKELFLYQKLCRLAENIELDLIFIQPSTRKILAEAVCFPSMWNPSDKVGKTIEEAHENVPGLNDLIGKSIDRFVGSLGSASSASNFYQRANLGIVQTNERNQHPKKMLPKLCDPENAYVRIEEQGFYFLPNSKVIVFGIRISHSKISDFPQRQELANVLNTMNEAMLKYKGICSLEMRNKIVEQLLKQ